MHKEDERNVAYFVSTVGLILDELDQLRTIAENHFGVDPNDITASKCDKINGIYLDLRAMKKEFKQ